MHLTLIFKYLNKIRRYNSSYELNNIFCEARKMSKKIKNFNFEDINNNNFESRKEGIFEFSTDELGYWSIAILFIPVKP